MLHPSYTDLMKVINSEVETGEAPVVNSRYSIVLASAKRARQLIAGADPLIGIRCPKPLSIAVDELYNSKIRILSEEEAAEAEAKKLAEEEEKKAMNEMTFSFEEEEEEEDEIVLSSYEIPEGEDKSTFSYSSMKNVDYAELKKSEKFTPAIYHEKDGIWEGGSVSRFSPVMTFKLWEKFSDSCLEVSESMEVNGKKTFGYDEPIIYKRV